MIRNNVVYGGPAMKVPGHLCIGKYIIESLRDGCENEDDISMINNDTGHSTTRKELLQNIVDFATGLKRMGVKRGDVIAMCSESRDEFATAILGAICCGATVTLISIIYTKEEIIHALNISRPNTIFCSKAALKKHYDTIKCMPCIKKIIQFDGMPLEGDILKYSSVAESADVNTYEPEQVHGSTDTAAILYSSGTTGLPKGVMLTHLNMLYEIAIFNTGVANELSSRVLIVLPWCHVYGLLMIIESIVTNKTIVYMSRFNPDQFLSTVQKYKVETLYAVPPIVVFLAKSPTITQRFDLSSLRVVVCGGAPLGSDIAIEALKCLPNCIGILQIYGMTETCLVAIKDYDCNYEEKPGSGGRPLPGIKAKIVDIESGQKLGPNQEGEVCLHGPIIMKGYMNNEAATRDIIDDEGYLKTGDVGYYDADGCFYIIDRIKELIKYNGHQVSPAFVESVILKHSGVAECAVVGLPDEAAGELPTAFVVTKPNVQLTEQELFDFVKVRTSPVQRLRGGIIFVKEIPKNPSGKILRRELRKVLKLHT